MQTKDSGLGAFNQSEHFLIGDVLEFSDTIRRSLVGLFRYFERTKSLHVHRTALAFLQERM